MYENIDWMVVVGGVEDKLFLQVQEAAGGSCHLHNCPAMSLSL